MIAAVSNTWKALEKLRGQMPVTEYKNYLLPFMFYGDACLRVDKLMREELEDDGLSYEDAWNEVNGNGEFEYRNDLTELQLDHFGFVIEPRFMFNKIWNRAGKDGQEYMADVLTEAFNEFDAMCNDTFKGNFALANLYNEALGSDPDQIDSTLQIVFEYGIKLAIECYKEDSTGDSLGAAYEELMKNFAVSAGKKGGEFYTPTEVSELVAKLATYEVDNAKVISDPTCGSGSLLLKAAKEIEKNGGAVGEIHGQEIDHFTTKLAKMNMSMHNINAESFDITCCDTLGRDQRPELRADVTVANPPYALEWDNSEYRLVDTRFAGYGALAPKSNADLAFVEHIIYHMSDNGHAAVLLPLGVLFRGNAEQTIRQAIIENYNYLDAVIVLPSNCFYGTGIPVCCLVLRKGRYENNNICFIDASNEYIKEGKKNKLTEENINKIYKAYTDRVDIEHFCSIVDREVIANNQYNLSMSLYVQAERNIEEHDLSKLFEELGNLEIKSEALKKKINSQLSLFGVTERFRVNEELASQYIEPEPKQEEKEIDADEVSMSDADF